MPLNSRIEFLTPDEVHLCRSPGRADTSYGSVRRLVINVDLEWSRGWSHANVIALEIKTKVSFKGNVPQLCLGADK